MRHIGKINRELREQGSQVRIVREGSKFRLVDIKDEQTDETLGERGLRALARQIEGKHK